MSIRNMSQAQPIINNEQNAKKNYEFHPLTCLFQKKKKIKKKEKVY